MQGGGHEDEGLFAQKRLEIFRLLDRIPWPVFHDYPIRGNSEVFCHLAYHMGIRHRIMTKPAGNDQLGAGKDIEQAYAFCQAVERGAADLAHFRQPFIGDMAAAENGNIPDLQGVQGSDSFSGHCGKKVFPLADFLFDKEPVAAEQLNKKCRAKAYRSRFAPPRQQQKQGDDQ
ncbi:MAG: hypothetical protein ACD_75C01320G0006 [uncultured bacterium]|nr:MAG: hypothetical protein ACD_75C01320G0006 [uncultured bacterium]